MSILHKELSELERSLSELRASSASAASASRELVSLLESRLETCQREMASRPTHAQVAALRQRLRLLQAVGYNAVEEGEEEEEGEGEGGPPPPRPSPLPLTPGEAAAPSSSSGSGAGQDPPSSHLVQQLLLKNRRVEHELTRARLAVAEHEEREGALAARLEVVEAEAKRQEARKAEGEWSRVLLLGSFRSCVRVGVWV